MSMIEPLLEVARARGIPVRPVVAGGPVWQFGQGAASRHFFAAASDRDGLSGTVLARHKGLANALLTSLGFPTTVQRVAASRDEVIGHARALGFPVVVKPVDFGMGIGVVAGIRDEAGLVRAIDVAAPWSQRGMIVERHVPGPEHRLTLCAGRLAWAVIRHPAQVTGDGAKTVEELVAEENARREADAGGYRKPIAIDEELHAQLHAAGLTLESRPPAGAAVTLRSVSNVSRGGTIEDCTTRVHPDVVEMAETIARVARLDVVGIDFITPDIARSWRDVPCAILEINATPAIFTRDQAERMMALHFPPGADGRIPTALLLDAVPAVADAVAAWFTARGLRVGRTTPTETRLGTTPRSRPGAGLAARVQTLVVDPACAALVIAVPAAAEVLRELPLDRVDVAIAPARMAAGAEAIAAGICREIVRAEAHGVTDAAAIAAALGRTERRYTLRC